MKKLSKKLIVSLLFLSVLFSNIPLIHVHAVEKINSITLVGNPLLVAGESAPEELSTFTVNSGDKYSVFDIGWFDITQDDWVGKSPLISNHDYAVYITLKPNTGYDFDILTNVSATINGNPARVDKDGNDFTRVFYNFGKPSASAPIQHDVLFINGGDASLISGVIVNDGEKVSRPTTNPTMANYTFDNWYADARMTIPFDFNTPITSNITIFAKFISNSVILTYTIESGDGQSFTLGGTNDIVIKASGDLAKLTAIKVDGTTLAGSNYKTESGNTVLTLLNSYLNTLSVGNHTVTFVYNDGSVEAALKVLAAQNQSKDETGPTVQTADMYRLYNPNSGEHFYTANVAEKDNLVGLGWRYEGVGWKAPVSSNTPVYRLYNKNAGDHHYTMSAEEKDRLVSLGWKYEGIGWYSDDEQSVPLYRQYNPNAKAGSHNYTTSKAENDNLVKLGWRGEGVGWYGVK